MSYTVPMDEDFNTTAHVDRDEARSAQFGGPRSVDWWNRPGAPMPKREPRYMCTDCTLNTSCDKHREAQAVWDARIAR